MIRLQHNSNKIILPVSSRLIIRYMVTPSGSCRTSQSTAITSTTNTPSAPFKFKFIPTINNNKTKPSNTTDSTLLSSSIKQKRLTSYSLPSRNILDKHEEIIKAKGKSQLETLNKVKEIMEGTRERGIIKRTANDENNISVSTNFTTTTTSTISTSTYTPTTAATASGNNTTVSKKKKKRTLRARKAVVTLTPRAIEHLKKLLDLPEPKMIRVSTKNRGCSGTQYDLSYVSKPEKFDEIVEQDGVRIIIDSKALFSVVGSEMDWIDDQLNTKFIFRNPNAKGTCGCGESFMI